MVAGELERSSLFQELFRGGWTALGMREKEEREVTWDPWSSLQMIKVGMEVMMTF